MELEGYIAEIARNVNGIIMGELEKGKSSPFVAQLYEASAHLFRGGGKRLRPAILVSSLDLFGGDRERGYLAGAAVEVIHVFTLIHDDIMDRDEVRRGLPTVHVRWGEPLAILAGDLLHALAFSLLGRSLSGLSSQVISSALDLFSSSIMTIAEGQAMDIGFEKAENITESDYLDMIRRKTAYLFACSAALGSKIARADESDVSKMWEFGIKIGTAFQIADDILGIFGDERETGKPVFSDIREGKKTILIIKALSESSSSERAVLLRVLGRRDPPKEDLEKAVDIIREKSLPYAQFLAQQYVESAISTLESVDSKSIDSKNVLREIAMLTIRRKK
jgi:geranylgeranyl diphosphate synthase type I